MPTLKILNISALLSAIAAIYFDFIGNRDLFNIFKPLTTILIILIPIICGNRNFKNYLSLTIVALLFCLIGDVFLLEDSQFVWGLAAFLIAHIIFTLSFIALDKFKLYYIPLTILSLIGVCYYLFIYHELQELAMPVLFYFAFIIIMCWQGINLYIWRKELAFKIITVAVILFLFSDAIIALNKFKFPFKLSGIIILATYWLSISLLANATSIVKKG